MEPSSDFDEAEPVVFEIGDDGDDSVEAFSPPALSEPAPSDVDIDEILASMDDEAAPFVGDIVGEPSNNSDQDRLHAALQELVELEEDVSPMPDPTTEAVEVDTPAGGETLRNIDDLAAALARLDSGDEREPDSGDEREPEEPPSPAAPRPEDAAAPARSDFNPSSFTSRSGKRRR